MRLVTGKLPERAIDRKSPRMRVRWPTTRVALVCLVLVSALCSALPGVQAQVRDDRAVKAAFVYNLTKYAEWPQLGSDIVIGIVSEDSTGEVFKTMLDGKLSESRTIRILLSPSDQDLERCNLVYIAGAAPNARTALDRVRKKAVLTVGDTESFTRGGGMVGLVTVGDHVQIQVNLQLARDSGLKISSRLLSIAVVSQSASGKD